MAIIEVRSGTLTNFHRRRLMRRKKGVLIELVRQCRIVRHILWDDTQPNIHKMTKDQLAVEILSHKHVFEDVIDSISCSC